MKVKHLKSGQVYETTLEEFHNNVVLKGNDWKFEILEKDTPASVVTIRQKRLEMQPAKVQDSPETKVKVKTKK